MKFPVVAHAQLGADCTGSTITMRRGSFTVVVCGECGQTLATLDPEFFQAAFKPQ